MFSNLPIDIINRILLYTGIVKYRNGKYMYQIPNTDNRYNLLDTIPRHRLCYINNKYILYVYLHIHSIIKYMQVKHDLTYNTIEYRYVNLLYNDDGNKYDIKYICPI